METTKERKERSMRITLDVTPWMYSELDAVKHNEDLRDKILKQFVEDEKNWLKDEIQSIDEITAIYRAKLLTIKDNFAKVQDVYVDEICKLKPKANEAFDQIENIFNQTANRINASERSIGNLMSKILALRDYALYIDTSKIEKLLDLAERFNKMDDTEKELIRLLLNQPKK